MASKVFLSIFILNLATLLNADGNLQVGDFTEPSYLLYHGNFDAIGMFFFKRTETFDIKLVNGGQIKAIDIQDLRGDSSSWILAGGVGEDFATIKLESSRGKGYNFVIDVYGFENEVNNAEEQPANDEGVNPNQGNSKEEGSNEGADGEDKNEGNSKEEGSNEGADGEDKKEGKSKEEGSNEGTDREEKKEENSKEERSNEGTDGEEKKEENSKEEGFKGETDDEDKSDDTLNEKPEQFTTEAPKEVSGDDEKDTFGKKTEGEKAENPDEINNQESSKEKGNYENEK